MSQKKYFTSNDARNLININGFAIFPIHGVNEDGTCTCNNPSCKNIGKHPATPDGFKSASKDIEKVKQMWAGRKGLNVGIATGEASGIFVIDCDTDEAYQDLKNKIELPDTLTVKTGRGFHLYFKYNNDKPVKNGTHVIENVDVRGSGGYVAGVGSNHSNGAVYDYVNPLEEIAEAPQDIYDLMDLTVRLPLPEENKLVNQSDFTNNPLRLYKSNDGWSSDDIAQHLNHIDPDCDYDTWIKVGMALHEEGAPFSLFDDWSKRGTKYDGSTAQHWKSFNKGGGVSYGTVVKWAQQGGWKPVSSNLTVTPTVIINNKEQVNPETGEITQAESSMYYIRASDMTYEPNADDFVQGLLTNGAISVVYGESNCGKTFFMTDLSFHVAENISWRDKRVEGGSVVYVALEGIRGLKGRIEAYKRHSGAKLDNFLVMPCPLNFLDGQGDINQFIQLLEKAKAEVGDIKLIVIDTLARALGGGDENSGQDMGALVAHADAIRAHTGAHICFVHHSGKDKAKGARGHSSLRAAVDTEIEISRSEGADYSSVKVVKQRDLEMESGFEFKLERIELGMNKHNEMTTSCVVTAYDVTKDFKRVAHIKPNLRIAYDALVECIGDKGRFISNKEVPHTKVVTNDDFKMYLENRGILSEKESSARVQYSNYRKELIAAELLFYRSGYLWIIENN